MTDITIEFLVMLNAITTYTVFAVLLLAGCGLCVFAIVSHRENESGAFIIAILLAWILLVLSTSVLWLASLWINLFFMLLFAIVLGWNHISNGTILFQTFQPPSWQFDERYTPFSIYFTDPDLPAFAKWIKAHAHQKRLLKRWQQKPGLLSEKSAYYNAQDFKAADVTFDLVATLREFTEGPISDKRADISNSESNTKFLKNWILSLGAMSVGITELKPYHVYTHIGRGKEYGQPARLAHRYALAFTVEMRKEMIDTAPTSPTIVESANRYLQSGTIALQVAEWIRGQGFPARAHIDGDYRVICPLVARDAGLGEIGRMGLLMTPHVGPRVRLAVITTDMPLLTSAIRTDPFMIEFCRICKKCADNCPVRAISFKDRESTAGTNRWRIDMDACFSYWCSAGTDCGICMRVCPYSHPDHFLHTWIRKMLRRSGRWHKSALIMDNLFYGRRPKPKKLVD